MLFIIIITLTGGCFCKQTVSIFIYSFRLEIWHFFSTLMPHKHHKLTFLKTLGTSVLTGTLKTWTLRLMCRFCQKINKSNTCCSMWLWKLFQHLNSDLVFSVTRYGQFLTADVSHMWRHFVWQCNAPNILWFTDSNGNCLNLNSLWSDIMGILILVQSLL